MYVVGACVLLPGILIVILICSLQLVILFGREGSQEANMGVLLRMVTTTTLSRASTDLWAHTDAVHGCLALLTASFKKTPNLVSAHHNHVAPLFHLGKGFYAFQVCDHQAQGFC